MSITHKERMRRALNHEPIDCIPTQINYTQAVAVCLATLAPANTGLVLGPSHRLMSDVPLENVKALLAALMAPQRNLPGKQLTRSANYDTLQGPNVNGNGNGNTTTVEQTLSHSAQASRSA